MARLAGPCTFDTQAPSAGQKSSVRRSMCRPVMHWYEVWPPSLPTIVRMKTNLSAICAMRGKCSQMRMPGTLVSMGLNSPRMSTGASGLRSHMSMWGGPPGR